MNNTQPQTPTQPIAFKFHFDFIKVRKVFFALSTALALMGIVSLVMKGGAKLGIEFTGGTLIQLRFQKPLALTQLREALTKTDFSEAELQSVTGQNEFIIRAQTDPNADGSAIVAKLQEHLRQTLADNPYEVIRSEFVGPSVGRQFAKQALLAVVFSLAGIVIYVAFRFKNMVWGMAGVLALAHDVFITFGLFSVLNKEISLTVVAALLTLAGYSINDTIVIFDRIRENLRLSRKESLYDLVNRSLNETLSRTIITSFTVFLVLVSLYFFGGEVIHDFAFALLFGVVIGSYSTIFIATPLVYSWGASSKR